MAAPGWPFSGNNGKKVSQSGSCDQALTVSCIVTQFARESFGVCTLGPCSAVGEKGKKTGSNGLQYVAQYPDTSV